MLVCTMHICQIYIKKHPSIFLGSSLLRHTVDRNVRSISYLKNSEGYKNGNH